MSSPRTRGLIVGTVLLGICSGALIVLALASTRAPPLDRARDVVANDARFRSPSEAASSLATVAELLTADARACAQEHDAHDPRCEARFAAAGYAQAMAVEVSTCRRPGIEEVRSALLGHLAPLRAGAPDGEVEPPHEVLLLPACD